ncbi:BTAD domain-containing putative transcriptional regulator [Umezawaea sp. NPDC059074]|uniref:BTAD domain-containing putative transcriptional regulator n=1 Tax=Umezawaea sp. NPDC059074 TaxID=3346716 RepID=UPI003685B521
MLGPLEVFDGDRIVGLGGTRQRATLGFLLLHLNRVVATSELLGALWTEEAPVSARKILQNAIWGLRGVLSSSGRASGSATLVTQTPGYMLSVDPEQVDLHGFHRLAEEGRSRLSSHDYEEASRILRQALGLWRGPALADLVETGLVWSELAVLQNVRLDVLEDYFETELACGRHHAVLGELERMSEAHPLRERSCAQLMLALYRCGRQADALTAFGRVRSLLVDELGLEPCRELRTLQHAILTHDETLTFSAPDLYPPIPVQVSRVPELVPEAARSGALAVALPGTARPVLLDAPDPEPVPARAEEVRLPPFPSQVVPAQRKHVSVLMVRTRLDLTDEADRFDVDVVLDSIADTIREGVDYFGGTIVASIGSVTLALFDTPRQIGNSAERAVRAALAIRDCLSASLETVRGARVVPHAAVTTGEALVRHQITEHGAPVTITGAPVEECQGLLGDVPSGETWISEATRAETEFVVLCHRVGDTPPLWQVDGARQETIAHHSMPVVDREPELELLRGLMDRAVHRTTPHLVTVLGAASVGKTRFLVEFQRRVVGHPTTGQFVLAHAYWPDQDGVRAVQAEILASCCGIARGDSLQSAKDKVTATVRGYLGPSRTRALLRLVDPACPLSTASEEDTTAAWRDLVAAVARDRGLVMVVDDLHCADDRLLAFIEDLTESVGPVPLLVIAAARTELVERRPAWSGGHKHATTLTLDPLSDAAIDRLLELLLTKADGDQGSSQDGTVALQLIPNQELDARREYVRMLLCLDRRMLTESAAALRAT